MTLQVLIIDDDPSFKKILELRLRSFFPSINITMFGNLSSVREFLEGKTPEYDLIILDQHLPDGHGVAFLQEGWFQDFAVLIVSSDESPEIPGASVLAGASFFLSKTRVSEPLFKPLLQGIIDRNRLQRQLNRTNVDKAVMESVRTLVATLRHEINNPLGAVMGAAYILRSGTIGATEQKEAADLVESSGRRIKHVLDELCRAISLEPVTKANQRVFHIPGDKPWE